MPKITKRTVDALKPHERERVVWDDDLNPSLPFWRAPAT